MGDASGIGAGVLTEGDAAEEVCVGLTGEDVAEGVGVGVTAVFPGGG